MHKKFKKKFILNFFKFFRSPRSRRCSSKTHCCRCLEKNKDLTKEEYRKYYNFFLTDNPNTECPKAGHAAYSDAVRTEVSRKVYLNNNTYEPNFPDLSVSASNFMVIVFYCKLRSKPSLKIRMANTIFWINLGGTA